MKGLNRVVLLGNLGGEPDVRVTPSDKTVATFSVAVNEKYKNAKGDIVESTEWARIVAWEGLAKIAADYLHKGAPVYVEGKMRTRSWEKEDGTNGYVTEVVATNLILLGSKDRAPQPSENDRPAGPVPDGMEITDADIPF